MKDTLRKKNKVMGELAQIGSQAANSPPIRTPISTEVMKSHSALVQKHKVALGFGVLIALFVLLYPHDSFSASLEEQLDAMNTLTTGKLKKYGISGATIGGGILALFKGNAKLAGIIIGIGIALGYYLSWIEGGMVI